MLQVSSTDLAGGRFNGHAIGPRLTQRGIQSRMLVWNRQSQDATVRAFLPLRGARRMNAWLGRMERARSIHARLQYQSFLLAAHPWFREADVVHYHLIHDGWFSLDALPFLTRRKPSLWTWHDPWIMTGHCIYPLGCGRWRTGCGACPDLTLPFAMRRDRTADQHRWKQGVVGRSRVEVILASRHMQAMAEASPIARGLSTHLLPFGVDLDFFTPGDVAAARARLGIRPDRVVIGFRGAAENMFKGGDLVIEALRGLPAELAEKLCLLSTHAHGQTLPFVDRHQVVELGWNTDPLLVRDSLLAADFFVMPSRAEAFGMMAIEAMACGKPVIVTDGTSLPEVTQAPEIGIAVPAGDVPALTAAILRLIQNPYERAARGAAGRALAEARYGEAGFADGLATLYRGAVVRRGAAP
ncbi:glycosyltransferase [Roseococcus suduntuyensis]|uniref:Glycosyltransferase involved in cell wall biosynthesis n=1 Tax=Roseococcus suduntuyensis TaxID=455361 RepID=A0A840AIC5_9PROT|nr:glycosyltransferase [Roseococcus suduntuyensis]MBB3900230.1 glycosyltransferase involved in cell wall biosynthesis [Roseococcus suduntuyensis]